MKDNNYLFPLAALALCCLALNFAPDFLYCRGTAVKFLLLPGLAVLACAALYLKKKDCLDGPASLFLLGSAAFLLHASFVLAIPYDEMQHDLFGEYGHPACIKSFLDLGFPCNYLSSGGAGMYYHPPLSPALAALWARQNRSHRKAGASDKLQFATQFKYVFVHLCLLKLSRPSCGKSCYCLL